LTPLFNSFQRHQGAVVLGFCIAAKGLDGIQDFLDRFLATQKVGY